MLDLAPIRSALIGKGMLYSPTNGDMAFTVPLFDGFMKRIMPTQCSCSSRKPFRRELGHSAQRLRPLPPRVDRLALECQHAERAFMHPPQRLALDEPVERFNPERKLADRQPRLAPRPRSRSRSRWSGMV